MKKIITLAVSILIILGTVHLSADVYVRQKTHTDAFSMMGQEQPAQDATNEMWFAKDKMAMIIGEQSIIVELDKNLMYWIFHNNKSYVQIELPFDPQKHFPAQLTQMMKNFSVEVSASGEKQKVDKWDCDGYDVNMNIMMMEMNQKVWATKDVPFDWKTFNEKMLPQMMGQGMLGEGTQEEFMKIQGFPIKTEVTMNMMGNDVKSSSLVEEIAEKAAPAGTYSVPEGYTKKDKLDIMDLQRR